MLTLKTGVMLATNQGIVAVTKSWKRLGTNTPGVSWQHPDFRHMILTSDF